MTWLQALLLAIVEGLTEFLPVSSTGHLIITSSFLGIASDPFTKLFTIAIQFGAILSVVVTYFKRFFKTLKFYWLLFLAFIPAAIMGVLIGDYIDALLENVSMVAFMLIFGGIILLFVDKWFKHLEISGDSTPKVKSAIQIGLFQCLALLPGVSRAAATIVGGLASGLNRTAAAEFSFFLAVPTLFAATAWKLIKYYQQGYLISEPQWQLLIIGNLIAFIVAWMAIKSFISWLTKHGFRIFGWYRIAVGLILLALQALGISLHII